MSRVCRVEASRAVNLTSLKTPKAPPVRRRVFADRRPSAPRGGCWSARPVRVPAGLAQGWQWPAVALQAACVVPPVLASSRRALRALRGAGAHRPSLGAPPLRRTTFLLRPVQMSEVEEPSAHRLPCVAPRLANLLPAQLSRSRLWLRIGSGSSACSLRAPLLLEEGFPIWSEHHSHKYPKQWLRPLRLGSSIARRFRAPLLVGG